MKKWRIEDSEDLYNINGWGASYFSINEKGHVAVTPKKDSVQVDLKELMDELQLRDVAAPVLVRFPDILDNRIEKIAGCFKIAAEEYNYKGENFIVYPIKVNQMRPVVEEITSHGKRYNIGLEAGSKPELHAVIAMNTDSDSLIICNGYKDDSYIELALLAQKMGRRIFLVVEKLNELKRIAKIGKRMGVRPNIGIRIKLASEGSGKWEESGGDASKFGLTSSELLEALEILEKYDIKDCLRLIHFHIGSQVTRIRHIKTALREASQFYVQLRKLGYNIEFTDIGGGLGVDYDGTRSSSSESSVNYSIQEYVNDAIWWMQPTRTAFPTPTSSPRVDVPYRHTTLYSSSRYWRQQPFRRWTRTGRLQQMTTTWPRSSTRYGANLTNVQCSRRCTMHSRFARRRLSCSATVS